MIPSALHGQDVINNCFSSFNAFNYTLVYNDTAFINAFSQVFLPFAVNFDSNAKLRPSIVPEWPKWLRGAKAEMVFNKTVTGVPDIAPVETSNALLQRCFG